MMRVANFTPPSAGSMAPPSQSGKRRLRPATAIRAASNLPDRSCAKRESTAPLIGEQTALGQIRMANARRLSLDTPILRPAPFQRTECFARSAQSARATQQSLGSSRFGSQNQSRPSAIGSGKSLAEWIAKSIAPLLTASSRSRVKKSGALRSIGVERSLSPGVSNVRSRALNPGTLAPRNAMLPFAWAMDSLLPLAPHRNSRLEADFDTSIDRL